MARQNDHIRAEELMSAYLDKRLSAEEKNFFERHIASCANCHAQLETTRSMVAALRAMPVVKAPRSFVLPREMAKQPRRSFLTLYPALRLATVIAAMAFVVLFAGDLLISQSRSGAAPQSLPAAAPAPTSVPLMEAARQAASTEAPAGAETPNDAAATSGGETVPPGAGALAAKAALSETITMTQSAATSMPTATPAATATAEVAMRPQATVETIPAPAEPMHDQQASPVSGFYASTNLVTTPPAVDPLRVIEITLLALAIVLGIATLVVRRRQA